MAGIGKKMEVDQDVLTLALERIHYCFTRFDRIAVAFSGGKDSTVILNLVLQVARERGEQLPLDVVFYDEEAIHPETIEYCKRVAAIEDISFRWFCIPMKHRNACSKLEPYWTTWDPEKEDVWTRPLPIEVEDIPGAQLIRSIPGYDYKTAPEINGGLFSKAGGTVGLMMGIRTQESLRRYRTVARRVNENYIAGDTLAKHVYLVKPIYDWKTEDVWTAPIKFDWDYNRAYDTMKALGIPAHAQRVCPPFGEEPLRGLWIYAQCWPHLWDKMTQRVDGAATAGRYARSPLYAFGADIGEWNMEEDPKDLIRRALERWEPETKKKVAHRIRVEIDNHYRKSDEPIPLETAGSTGVTWKYLYMLAYRGDLKGRRTPNYNREDSE